MAAKLYDCAIIGGGLAGLSLSVLLARAGHQVILFEKETYPLHKVCGEYISNESVPFLTSLGVDLKTHDLPQISKLMLTATSGIAITRPLDIGGTGISRYELDNQLYHIAQDAGVEVYTKTKVQQVLFKDGIFTIQAGGGEITARTAIGAYGKNSNIDVQLGRKYKNEKESQSFIAVKHHIRAGFDRSFVQMHTFPGGYCGMSGIEDGKVNMSYISKVSNLKAHGSIAAMEKNVLSLNPYLKKHFEHAEFIFPRPLTISHLYFQIKQPVTDHILMLGDAAGNIAPLSGNGMSIAMQSAKLAYGSIVSYLSGAISLAGMETKYQHDYYRVFSTRIGASKFINRFFVHPALNKLVFPVFKLFPWLVDMPGRKIHGEPF